MKAKHTPGPWKFINDTLVRGPHGEPIASTKGFAFPFAAEHEANAKLIAAAPDLLEACKALLGAYASKADYSRPKELHSSVLQAYNAITKAEGRE